MCIENYTFKWIIDQNTRMLLKDGTVAEGLEEIEEAFAAKNILDGVEKTIEMAGNKYPVISVKNLSMFNTRKYIVLKQ